MSKLITNLPRWIVASVNKYVEDNKGGLNIVFEEEFADVSKFETYVQLRINGPYIKKYTRTEYKASIEVSALITAKINDKNRYVACQMMGQMGNILETDICVYRYGDGPDDNQQQIGSMQIIINTPKSGLTMDYYGTPDKAANFVQAAVEAVYLGDFDGSI